MLDRAVPTDYLRNLEGFKRGEVHTARHRTVYIERGPSSGPLVIFAHGMPELSIVWLDQMEHLAKLGWRCVAADLRGFGGSSVPQETAAYAIEELTRDMAELHDALGGEPAIWVGHDWGATVLWSVASQYPERCRGVANMCVPYLPRGYTLPNIVATVDRKIYPQDRYPVGQWDYWLYYRESFSLAVRDRGTDVAAAFAAEFRSGDPANVGKPAPTANLREKQGFYGPDHRAPAVEPDPAVMQPHIYRMFVEAYQKTGFAGGTSYYLNDAANAVYAGQSKNFGRLTMPVLFVHAEYDVICETMKSRFPEQMREECSDLTEAKIPAGHFLMLEKAEEVSKVLESWLAAKNMHP